MGWQLQFMYSWTIIEVNLSQTGYGHTFDKKKKKWVLDALIKNKFNDAPLEHRFGLFQLV